VTVVVDRRPKVIYPVGLCVDTYRQRLYWYDIEYRSISTSMYNGLDFVLYRRAHSFRFSVENLAVHKVSSYAVGVHNALIKDRKKISYLTRPKVKDSKTTIA